MNLLVKTSSNLYTYWNIGSMLMMFMSMQIIVGIMISMHYFYMSSNLFNNSMTIFTNFNYGWMLRSFHSNFTSLIFMMIFAHMMRSMMYKNFINKKMWNTGMIMLMMIMASSFMGYSLINSQMSYWAMMVITNFMAVIPLIGKKMLLMIWGNKFISNILLNRLFSIHFIVSLMTMMISIMHLMILHLNKSSNPLSLNNKMDQINLNPTLILKDLLMTAAIMLMMMVINSYMPKMMNNPDNFNQTIMLKTPSHIEPEWYFLFFYTILRSSDNKLNGLMILLSSIIMWFLMPKFNKTKIISNKFNLINKFIYMMMILNMILLTFTGSKTLTDTYKLIIKNMIMIYFMMFLVMLMTSNFMNKF